MSWGSGAPANRCRSAVRARRVQSMRRSGATSPATSVPATRVKDAKKGVGLFMTFSKLRTVFVAAIALVVCALGTASATAAFPNFSDCPRSTAGVIACIDIQNTSGNLNIKGFNVPLGAASLEIRGGLTTGETGNVFIPPTGTTGLFSRPFEVPGGLLGIDFPIPGNAVQATTQLAGSPSAIRLNLVTQSITLPVKVKLSNFLLGMACYIGTDRNPVTMNLITGTTNPPPPNAPISGHRGTIAQTEEGAVTFTGNLNVDNSFAVPASSSCGFGLGLINALVDAKLKLPSAAGNNATEVVNNVGLKVL